MRSTIAYYLLLVYALMLVKPLVPVVSDVMSHTFAEAVHLSSVHMVYGADHTQQEFAKETTDKKNNNQQTLKADESSTVHLVFQQQITLHPVIITNSNFTNYYNIHLSNPDFVKQGPPPKFS